MMLLCVVSQILISVIVTWIFAAILTAAGIFPDDPKDIRYNARTDINGDNIYNTPTFRIPYPGQYGMNFDVEYFLIFLVSILITVIESFGAYHQYAMSCRLPAPPAHAINRGILIEGVGGLLAASCGMGCATTTYGNMIGIIHITKVASRKVYIAGGVIFIIVGLLQKIGAFLCGIPKPVLAGPVFIGISLLAGSAYSCFQSIDLARSRNQTTLGISLVAGIFLPFWINANRDAIDTGSVVSNRILTAILGVPFLVGGIIACILDCTLPGPREDPAKTTSGPIDLADEERDDDFEKVNIRKARDPRIRVFDPPFIGNYVRQWRLSRYIPIFPNPDLLKVESNNGETVKITTDNGRGYLEDDDDKFGTFKMDAETWYKTHHSDV